ncbi:MAG: ATP-dependent DNA helicase [Candidatus Hadarchaeales archaeon]
MEIQDVCKKYNLPEKIVEILGAAGIRKLFPPQKEAIEAGVLDGKSLVLSVPTAAGKTLVAELCMLKSILKEKGKCLYVVPLRALASEKYEEFKQRYEQLGIRVGISTGDFDTADPKLAMYDILVATSEKVDSLLRHRAKWLADIVTVVVLDEIHLLNDPERGPTLEILATRLRQVNPRLQILALSATIRNSDEIAEWIGAELVLSDWRPVPLKKGVYLDGEIIFEDGERRKIKVQGSDLETLSHDVLQEKGQLLIFVNTRKSSQTVAEILSPISRLYLSQEEKQKLREIAKEIEGALGETTKTCRLLASCVRDGSAFHHAGLHHLQRRAVERGFKSNLIKIICATPTLAAGVNLPARRVIVRDYRRYVEPYGLVPIPVMEFHQFCGRAGRPQYDKFGEAILITHSEAEAEVLLEDFIKAPPERVTSKLATEPALRTHVLASIAAGYATNWDSMRDFMRKTFFAFQFGVERVESVVERVLDFLEKNELITVRGDVLTPTPFGELTSALYIDPLSAVIIRDGLKLVSTTPPSDVALLHLISSTPDMPPLYLGEKDYEWLELEYSSHRSEFLVPVEEEDPILFEQFLASLKTALMLKAWVEEEREDDIHEKFGVGAGDIRRMAETAEWLLYSSHQIAKLFKVKPALNPLRKLTERIRYGVKEELLELVQLEGIGRVRARSLFSGGFKTLKDIAKASEAELASLPYIGKEIARSIKRQVETLTF